MATDLTQWLMEAGEPWTRYRTLVDLLDRPEDDPDVRAARAAMLAHPQVQSLIAEAAAWPGRPLKRHNDAGHPLYRFSTLADFGVRADDPGMEAGLAAALAHQSAEGAFQSLLNIFVHADPHFQEMVATVTAQAGIDDVGDIDKA